MAVRSKRLFGPVSVATTPTIVYTCPAGETALLKSLWIWPTLATVTGIEVFLNGTAAGNHIGHIVTPNSGEARVDGTFIVLHPGDILRLQSANAPSTVAGFGAELEGVAD